jgi:hypothetical protein
MHNMQVGETQSIVDESGRSILISTAAALLAPGMSK